MTAGRHDLKQYPDDPRDAFAVCIALFAQVVIFGLISLTMGKALLQLIGWLTYRLEAPGYFELIGWLEVMFAHHGLGLLGAFALLVGACAAYHLAHSVRQVESGDGRWQFHSVRGERVLATSEILAVVPVSPIRMFFLLSPFPFSPLLSPPVSVRGWMRLRLRRGDLYVCPVSSVPSVRGLPMEWPEKSQTHVTATRPGATQSEIAGLTICLSIVLLYEAPQPAVLIGIGWALFWITKHIQRRRLLSAIALRTDTSLPPPPSPIAARRPSQGLGTRLVRVYRRWLCLVPKLLFIWPLGACLFLWRLLLQCLQWPLIALSIGGRLACFAMLAWVGSAAIASVLGLLTLAPQASSASSPIISRMLLMRTPTSERPEVSTGLLERASLVRNPESVRAIALSGADNGVFTLQGYGAPASCRPALGTTFNGGETLTARMPALTAWLDPATFAPLAGAGDEEMRAAVAGSGVRFKLAEAPDLGALVKSARCALDPRHLPFSLTADAFRLAHPHDLISLHIALESGNPDLLNLAVQEAHDLEASDWQGRSPLIHALDEEASSLEGSRLRASSPTSEARMVEMLIEAGASLQATDLAGRSVTFVALGRPWSVPAERGGFNNSTRDRLLAAAPLLSRTAAGATLLHAAAASGSVELLQRLMSKGVSPQALTYDGRSPLHFARGKDAVRLLLAVGLSPDQQDQRRQTPLHLAVQRGDFDSAEMLGRYSADKTASDIFGKTAFDYAPSVAESRDQQRSPNKWDLLRNDLMGETSRMSLN